MNVEEAGADGVREVVEGVCGVVRPVHDLAFDGFEGVAFFSWGEFDGEVVSGECPVEVGVLVVVDEVVVGRVVRGVEFGPEGFVFEDAVEEGAGGVHAGSFGREDALREDAECLCVALEAAVIASEVVECSFAGVAEGGVAEVV